MARPAVVVAWVSILGLLPVSDLRADVLVVGPGEAFTQIQPAVDAAVDWDIVLVKTGSYASFTIVDKSLTVVADTGAVVSLPSGVVVVRDLAADRMVALLGLAISGTAAGQAAAVQLIDNAGSVRVERCQVTVGRRLAASIAGCADVAFTECLLMHDEVVVFNNSPSSSGVVVTQSTVAFLQCQVLGGKGFTPQFCPSAGTPGHPGLVVQDAVVFAAESVFQGGEGGRGTPEADLFTHFCNAAPGGPGGPGIRIEGASLLRRRGVTPLGGAGGLGGPGCGGFGCSGISGLPGPAGPPVQVLGGIDAVIPGLPHGMDMPVPLREQEAFTAEFDGVGGELAACFLSLSTANVFALSALGQLLVWPENLQIIGIVPPSGTLTDSDVFTEIPGLEGITGYFQPLFLNDVGQLTLGSPIAIVILDSSF